MTVRKLIEVLKAMPEDATVMVWSGSGQNQRPIGTIETGKRLSTSVRSGEFCPAGEMFDAIFLHPDEYDNN